MDKADSIRESLERYYERKRRNEKEIEEMNDEMKKIDDLNKTIDGLNAEIEHMDAEISGLRIENEAMRRLLHAQVDARINRLVQARKELGDWDEDILAGKWSF